MKARCGLIALALLAGCAGTPTGRAGRGAADAARGYCEALLRQDWDAAYRLIHADSRAKCSRDRFGQLAQNYRRGLGMDPEEMRLRACEEQGDRAIAHVVLVGRAGGRKREYREALSLRRDGEAWGVVLPPRFGQPATR